MKWFRNKKIMVKLLIGFLITSLITVIVGSVGVMNLISLESSANALYQQNALSLQYSGEASTTFQMVRYSMLRLTTYDTKEEINSGIATINDLFTQTDAAMSNLDHVLYSNEARGYYSYIVKEWDSYKGTSSEVFSAMQSFNDTKASQIIEVKLAPIGTSIRDNYTSLSNVVATQTQQSAGDMIRQGTMSVWIMAGVVVVGLIVSVLLAVYISRLIGIPVRKMVEAADQLALGDADIEIKVSAKDEIGKLAEAMRRMIEVSKKQVEETHRLAGGDLTVDIQVKSEKDALGMSLSELVDGMNTLVVSIMTSAEQVASGANLVSNSSMALSQGASEQASSVEELTASLEEVAVKTTENAQNAKIANQLAQTAKDDAELGNTQMRDMLGAMDEISAASTSINKIIKVIDDIAFQTNILALNAAVEAARAGQHGRGFAVVAEEVRTLAARSAQAAKETTDLIEGSLRKVEAGTRIANATADALGKIVREVTDAAQIVGSIASASDAQASAVRQINQGIQQVSQVVQSNAATSEEGAAASEELSSQAEQLKETVSAFKLKQRHSASVRPAAQKQQAEPAMSLKASEEIPALALETGSFGKY